MIQVTEEQVRDILPMDECVRIMRQTFTALRKGTASNQPRRRIYLDNGSTLHSMGGVSGKYFGTKFYSSNPRCGANFFFFLFDSETARPLAQFEANYLGQIRTGAASGYATTTLAVIGSGSQAQSQIDATRCVRFGSGRRRRRGVRLRAAVGTGSVPISREPYRRLPSSSRRVRGSSYPV